MQTIENFELVLSSLEREGQSPLPIVVLTFAWSDTQELSLPTWNKEKTTLRWGVGGLELHGAANASLLFPLANGPSSSGFPGREAVEGLIKSHGGVYVAALADDGSLLSSLGFLLPTL